LKGNAQGVGQVKLQGPEQRCSRVNLLLSLYRVARRLTCWVGVQHRKNLSTSDQRCLHQGGKLQRLFRRIAVEDIRWAMRMAHRLLVQEEVLQGPTHENKIRASAAGGYGGRHKAECHFWIIASGFNTTSDERWLR
jgi:hypothetical protein